MKNKTILESDSCSGQSFMSGVLVLSLSTVIVKVIGLAYKIPMIAYLGAEGMGYFNSAYEIYALLCVISTAGLPVALSMLVATSGQREGDRHRIYRSALAMFLILGGVGSLLMLLFADPIALAIGNPQASFCIFSIAPALFCVCFSGAVRGYFQGLNRMTPTAISQLIEALGKLIFGVWFAALAMKGGRSVPEVAAFAVLGLSLGTLLSALYLFLVKAAEPGEKRNAFGYKGKYGMTLLRIAVPITLASAVLNVTRLIDMTLILRRLQAMGIGVSQANAIYGAYTTLAVPVFGLIPSLITPVSMALVPQLSAALERRQAEAQAMVIDRSLRLTVLLSMPASMGITLYAKPILSLLFAKESESVAIAAPLLSLLGISILFSGLITTTNGVLQSYRSTVKPIFSMAAGAAVKWIVAYWLLGIPAIGVYGAPISTFACNFTVTAMNLRFISTAAPKSRKVSGFFTVYGKPLLASLLAMLASLAIYLPIFRLFGHESLAFFAAAGVAVLIYGLLAVLLRIVTAEDIALLPFGERLIRFGTRFRGNQKRSREV